MAFLKTCDLEVLHSFVGSELIARWEGIEKKVAKGNIVTIANTGLFSSGKSKLFNALIDKIEEERFPVGAIPTTKTGDRETFYKNIELIDTPGIDANETDDSVAFDMLMQADIIIMTHNIKTGMLNFREYSWLQNIAERMSQSEIGKRIIFVCTWIDEMSSREEIEKVTTEIKRQIKEAIGCELPFFEVSANRYYTGKIKNKKPLEQASQILNLKEYLINAAVVYSNTMQDTRKNEICELCKETKKQLKAEKKDLLAKCKQIETKICKRYEPRFNKWVSILNNFCDLKNDLSQKLDEIKKES